jgi:hypothetical protein
VINARTTRTRTSCRSGLPFIALLVACNQTPANPDPTDAKVAESSAATHTVHVISAQPPEDRGRSPYTGYTRAHWEAVLGRLVRGHALHLSPGKAHTLWSGRPTPYLGDKQGLEGVARLMHPIGAWLVDPSTPNTMEFEGARVDVVAMMREALLTGTDSRHAEYWGDIGDVDQRIVETADISWFLWLTRERLWNQLSPDEQTQIVAWLRQVDLKKVYHSNWHMFPLTNHTVRKHLGQPYLQDEIRRHHERTDIFLAGDGWYSDGSDPRHFDFYNPWAFHPGKLQWVHLDGDNWPEERDLSIRVARAFVYNFPYFFGSNGALPAWGRSLTYRFSVLATPLYLRWLGASPLTDGQLRRMCSGQLQYFVDHGAITAEGQISQGYWGTRPAIVEQYIGTGSPNWTARGLVALLFPEDHPFWTSVEQPLPVEHGDFQRTIPAAGMSLVGTQETGQVQMLSAITSHGSSNDYPAKYGKLRYSTHFLPNVLHTDEWNYAPDAMLLLSIDGEKFCQRIDADWGHAMPGAIVSGYGCERERPIARIVSGVVAEDEMAVTIHLVTPEADIETLEFVEGSLALEAGPDTKRRHDLEQRWSHATGEHGSVFSKSLHGYDAPLEPGGFTGDEGLNLAYERSIQAMLVGKHSGAQPFMLVSLSVASPKPFVAAAFNDVVRELEVDVEKATATFTWGAGERVFVSLMQEPPVATVRLGELVFEGNVRVARVTPDRARVSGGGIRRIRTASDPSTILYEATGSQPATVLLEVGPQGIELHTDQPCRIDAPTASGSVTVPQLDAPGGTRTVHLERDGPALVLTPAVHTAIAADQDLTLAMLEIPLDDP